MFDDLIAQKTTKPATLKAKSLRRSDALRSDAPEDYLDFLKRLGAGPMGDGYTLYSGLVEPQDIYGDQALPILRHILLFGDDMQGYCAGFDVRTWEVVEIDPTNHEAAVVAKSFEDFIRARLAR